MAEATAGAASTEWVMVTEASEDRALLGPDVADAGRYRPHPVGQDLEWREVVRACGTRAHRARAQVQLVTSLREPAGRLRPA